MLVKKWCTLCKHIVASELKDPIWHSLEWQIGSFSSEATILLKRLVYIFSWVPLLFSIFQLMNSKVFSRTSPLFMHDFSEDTPITMKNCTNKDFCLLYTTPILAFRWVCMLHPWGATFDARIWHQKSFTEVRWTFYNCHRIIKLVPVFKRGTKPNLTLTTLNYFCINHGQQRVLLTSKLS